MLAIDIYGTHSQKRCTSSSLCVNPVFTALATLLLSLSSLQENVVVRAPDASPLVQQVLLQSDETATAVAAQNRAAVMLTSYHAVPKLEATNAMLAKW
jgi:predicted permease